MRFSTYPYIPGKNPQKRSSLGRPTGEGPKYIVEVFYGGKNCDESLEGPFATLEEAAAFAKVEWGKGYGTLVWHCANLTLLGWLATDARLPYPFSPVDYVAVVGPMRIVIELDESLTVGANIEGVTRPSREQAEALLNLARVAGNYRQYLLDFDRHTPS